MKIPTSVFVMSLVTAVPFALAIRDTINAPKYEDDVDALNEFGRNQEEIAQRRALERYEQEARLEAEERAHVAAGLGHLFGTEQGTLGDEFGSPTLDGISPDASYSARGASVSVYDDGVRVQSLSIHVYRGCQQFVDKLEAAWGESYDHVYIAPNGLQRAKLQSDSSCTLEFERIVPVADWIGKSITATVPLGALGQPVEKLRQSLGDIRYTVDDVDGFSWRTAGVGRASGGTTIDVYAKNGKVIGLNVQVPTDDATAEAIRDHLTSLYGNPKFDEVYGYSDWKSPKLHFEKTSTHVFVTAGTIP